MRLIDADYTEEFVNHFTLFEGKPLTDEQKKIIDHVVITISKMQPTAYDIEAVIKELEAEAYQEMKMSTVTGKRHRGIAQGLHRAVQIVRKA